MKLHLTLLIFVLSAATLAAKAEEGMYLFNAPPKAQVKAKYNFDLTPEWLDHLQLSSARFSSGGSGSFVSPDGLAFTNHHVASLCLHGLSTKDRDYVATGFYAKTRAEEARCPNLELDVLQEITDVTEKINAAAKPGISDAQAGTAERAAMSAIEKECATAPDIRCDVVTLYAGGMYHLYRYKKYTDLRLVFAPEFQMAFFGGDPDNFEYPRYDLDITFFRAYENNQPVHLENYLHWSSGSAKDGDLIFVAGHPGSTARLNTMNQLEFLRTAQYPFTLKDLHRRIELHHKFADESPENARIAAENIFGLENSYKAVSGYDSGLEDLALMNRKKGDERKMLVLGRRGPSGANLIRAYQGIDHALETYHKIYLPLTFLERRAGFRGELNFFARTLVRATAEKQKPNGERLREYRESNLASLEQELFSSAPIYKSLEILQFADSLKEMQETLGADNPIVIRVLNGRTPDDVAKEAIDGTKLDQVDFRKQLYAGGAAAIASSTDPLIVLMRDIDPDARALRTQYDDGVDSVVRRNSAAIAKFRFQTGGASTPPDATFTLRLSYGQVKGYIDDGRGIVPKGTPLEPFTHISGAYSHAAEHGDKPPYQLPASWIKNKKKVNLKTPLNFVSTADIIGGNSGSPVVNNAGELVGVIFDGDIQSLPWNFQYDDAVGRAVSVDSRGIVEALRRIYHADALVKELTRAPSAKHKKSH